MASPKIKICYALLEIKVHQNIKITQESQSFSALEDEGYNPKHVLYNPCSSGLKKSAFIPLSWTIQHHYTFILCLQQDNADKITYNNTK